MDAPGFHDFEFADVDKIFLAVVSATLQEWSSQMDDLAFEEL